MTNTSDRLQAPRLVWIGRLFFAIALIAWGLQHLASGDFVTRVVPSWPAWMPARMLAAYIVGVILVAAGSAIALRIQARTAALVVAGLTGLSWLFLHLPMAAASPAWSGVWTGAGKGLVMWTGALCVAASLSPRLRDGWHAPFGASSSPASRDRMVLLGRAGLGAFMVLAGIQHFLFAPFVATLIPAWIPGALFWTYLAGVALIAGGIGLLIPPVAYLAALCSGAMIFSWVFLVHLPLVLRAPRDANNMAAIFEALAFSGIAFLLAGLIGARGSGSSRRA